MRIFRRLRSLFRRDQLDRDMAEEMRFHIDERTDDHVEDGMRPDEAHAAAHRKFGGVAQIQERARDVCGLIWLESIARDIRYAARSLRKSPWFTLIAIATLAVGIGATTAILNAMQRHLFDPIPGENDDRMVEIRELDTREARFGLSAYVYLELKRRRDVFDQLATFGGDLISFERDGLREMVQGCAVTPEFFGLLGVQPALGRWLTPEEEASSADDLIVISHSWWKSRFGGDREIVGRRIIGRDEDAQGATAQYKVIGVMPPHFQFPLGNLFQYWRPLRFSPDEVSGPSNRRFRSAVGLLADGVSIEDAQAQLDALNARLVADYSSSRMDSTEFYTINARPFRDYFVAPEVRTALWSATVAAAFVLLIVCANLSNLQLARGESRSREMSVRAALGAGRWRVIRQLLTESTLVALMGGASGWLLMLWLRKVCESLIPDSGPALQPSAVTSDALAWTVGIAVVCGVAFGASTAWRAAGCGLHHGLKDGCWSSPDKRWQWLRNGLVVTQVALALVLLVTGGLLVSSTIKLLHSDPGLRPEGLVFVNLYWPQEQSAASEAKEAVNREILDRMRALPGTKAVGLSAGGGGVHYYLPGRPDSIPISLRFISGTGESDPLRVMGVRLKEGRWLESSDLQTGRRAVLINESMATQCWPGESPIGKVFFSQPPDRVTTGLGTTLEVVGLVRSFDSDQLGGEPRSTCYLLSRTPAADTTRYVVRTDLDPTSFEVGVRRICRELLSGAVQPRTYWVEQALFSSTAPRRMLTWLLVALAGVGLFLALLGVFGVLLYGVVRRTREIGIRVALGAQKRQILAIILQQGLALVGIGLLIGIVAAWALTRLMRGLFFGVSPTDPLTFVLVPLLCLAVALLACYLPARRAAKVDPVIALRAE